MRNGNLAGPLGALIGGGVLTVPMRNGNESGSVSAQELKKVLTVPMRNGNLMNCTRS